MNHGLKALLLAAATIITCIIVGLGFGMAREAKQIGNYVIEELHRYRTAIEEQDYTKYDGATVYGNDIVNLMKKELVSRRNGMRITVETGGDCHSYTEAEDVDKVQEFGTVYYIVPMEEYVGEVVRNRNDVIEELVFTKKERTEDNQG